MDRTNIQRSCGAVARMQCRPSLLPVRSVGAAAAAFVVLNAHAIDLDFANPDLVVRWDNTVKYSAARRLKDPLQSVLADPNGDDGDRNFRKGLISSRFDLFSELDVIYQKNAGFRLSGAAWSDAVYRRSNANPGFAGGAVPNQTSVPYNQFTRGTRDVHGRNAEVLDAFAFGKFDLAGFNTTFRAGRHSLLWGESVFFGGNAIAGGQMPVDVVKLTSVPNTQFKEAIRPVPMLSGQIQLNSNVSVGAYLQTSSSKLRASAVGSYFSNSDLAVDGAENLFAGSFAPRQPDRDAKRSGQGGLQLKMRDGEVDYGLYAVQFHDKSPQVVVNLGPNFAPVSYYQAYHESIRAIGASASRTFGDYNVAAEFSLRNNVGLASTHAADLSGAGIGAPSSDNAGNPAYAVGRTAHLNISVLGNVQSTPLWKEASIVGEVAWNRVLRITKNAAAADQNATRDGVAMRVLFTPLYRGVMSGMDLGVPIGVGYAPKGSRPLAVNPNGWIPAGGGDISIGLDAIYLDGWRASLSYTHYFGPAAPLNDPSGNYSWGQTMKDRDFISFSARYTF